MHTLTSKRVDKFSRDFGFDYDKPAQFEYYIAATYLYKYLKDDVEGIERVVLGGGNDEGIDIGAVVVNGTVVFEPEEVDDLIADQGVNSAKVVFIQAKTSESYDAKLLAKFLHGVEAVTEYAMEAEPGRLPPRLVDLAELIDRIAENGDKFADTRIPCELYYVTTSPNTGESARDELQVTRALDRIRQIGVYTEPLALRTHGHEDISVKQREKLGPQNIRFQFDKNQAIPATGRIDEAYIGLISAPELLKLLKDESGDIRAGIFDDNVRLDLGPDAPVNRRIMGTLTSEGREQFPFLNNGLTIVATELRNSGGRFFVSGYQIVNGGQTSHQLIRWSYSDEVESSPEIMEDLWIPIKIVSSRDPEVRTSIAVATNLQTAIGSSDIQASSQMAKNVEEFFSQSGSNGLRYERQSRGGSINFAKTRVVTTPELNRAVAATLFGESYRAIGAPKDLEKEDSYVWDEYPVEAYYYAAWILYRIDRYFARTPEFNTLKAAKYHIAMMVSALVNRKFVGLFRQGDMSQIAYALKAQKGFEFSVASGGLSGEIEDAIVTAVEVAAKVFSEPLAEGRSLRKDDVRSRRSKEDLLDKITAPREGASLE